jgi:hypothetical protein
MKLERSIVAADGEARAPHPAAVQGFGQIAEYGAIALIFLLANYLVLTKAALVPFTYDEAYSDLVYAQAWNGFRRLDFANNHPLNSFAMYVMSRVFGHEPFALRLPNILSFYVFAGIAFMLARKLAMPAFAFAALTMNALLLEFFSLARGYGISAAFALAGFAILHLAPPARPLLTRACVLAALFVSAAAYSPMAIGILAALCIFMTRDVTERTFAPLRVLGHVAYLAAFIYFTRRVAQVSADGLPLYATSHVWQSLAGPGLTFLPGLLTGDGLHAPKTHEYIAGAVFLALLVLVPLLASLRPTAGEASRWKCTEAAAWCVLILIGTIAIPALLGRQLPLARTLLPFIPIWVLGVLICCEPLWWRVLASRARSVVSLVLAALVTGLCLAHTSLSEMHYWRHEKTIDVDTLRAVIEAKCATPEQKRTEAFTFYLAYYFAMGRDDIPLCRPQ